MSTRPSPPRPTHIRLPRPTRRIRRDAYALVDQLIEVMPDLQGVRTAIAAGPRRNLHELGIAAVRALS